VTKPKLLELAASAEKRRGERMTAFVKKFKINPDYVVTSTVPLSASSFHKVMHIYKNDTIEHAKWT